jgi:hypothetical protein
MDGCAAFVADFLAFEPLEDPLHPPEFLPSPMNTLLWQVIDQGMCASVPEFLPSPMNTLLWQVIDQDVCVGLARIICMYVYIYIYIYIYIYVYGVCTLNSNKETSNCML